MSDAPARPVPAITPEMAPFWDAARRHELVVQRCLELRRAPLPRARGVQPLPVARASSGRRVAGPRARLQRRGHAPGEPSRGSRRACRTPWWWSSSRRAPACSRNRRSTASRRRARSRSACRSRSVFEDVTPGGRACPAFRPSPRPGEPRRCRGPRSPLGSRSAPGDDPTVRPAALALAVTQRSVGSAGGLGYIRPMAPRPVPPMPPSTRRNRMLLLVLRHGPRDRPAPRAAPPRAVALLEGAAHVRPREHRLLARSPTCSGAGCSRASAAARFGGQLARQAVAAVVVLAAVSVTVVGIVDLAARRHRRSSASPTGTRHPPHRHAGDAAARGAPLRAAARSCPSR